jgi:single-strand DNA-binding protein
MSFEIHGKLHKKFEIESKSASFQTRDFVLLIEEGNYPQHIKFQLTQDRCNIIDNINEGENMKVWFDLRGREWNEKYFTNLNAWKVEKQNTENSSKQENSPDEIDFPNESDFENMAGSLEDDLPF